MKLSKEIVDTIKTGNPDDVSVYLTTSDIDGKCNILPSLFIDIHDDEFVLIPDLFAVKTKINLNENRVGVISVTRNSDGRGWALRGPCGHVEWGLPDNYIFQGMKAGEILKKWGDWSQKDSFIAIPEELRPTVLAQRGVIVLKVAECFTLRAEGT